MSNLKKGEIVRVKIEKLAFGGKGIGTIEDGRKIFIEGCVPGDLVDASLKKIKKNYVDGDLVNVIEASGDRIQPRCKHFDICGGCKWQMLPYELQIKHKEEQVIETLEHTGGFKGARELVRPIIGCAEPWFYRNKMEFSFGNSSKDDTEVRLGLHPAGKRIDIFDVEECFLGSETVSDILNRVRGFVREHNLSFYNHIQNEGLLSSLYVREGKNTGEIMINLVTCTSDFKPQKEFVELLSDIPEVVSIYWTIIKRKRGTPTRHVEHLLYGKHSIVEELKRPDGTSLKFKISPQAFFQPNTKQAEILYAQALEAAELTEEDVLFDLYCGTGTIGLFCANKAKQIYGLEINESAIKNAKQNAMLNGVENSWFKAGDVDRSMLEIPSSPDVVIVDPPRSGLGEKVVRKVADFEPKRIVYVSCNPASLSRDLAIFEELGYKLEYVQPIDMFPHTYHVENVVRLVNSG